jgi:maltose O-acetyltransferase
MINAFKRGLGLIFIKALWFMNECIYERYRKKYRLNPNFRFNGSNILFYGDGSILAGDESYIGEYSTVQAVSGYKVVIGKKCQISHNVRIYTASDIADQDFSSDFRASKNGDVLISDYVWIGANVFINPGIKIGANSIVGANSVLTRDVPSNSIVGGVPAKVIKLKSI